MRIITKERIDEAIDLLAKELPDIQGEERREALWALASCRRAEAEERKAVAMEREADNSDRKRDAYLAACKAVQDFFIEIKPKVMELLAKQ